jgi:DNA-damage-inducible protein J
MIRARTTPRLKHEAEKVLDNLGLTPSEAINLFYRQVCLRRGLPFAVEIPNDTTVTTFAKTDRGDELVHAKNEDDLFKKLGI